MRYSKSSFYLKQLLFFLSILSSREVCMTYPDFYWLKRLSVTLRGHVHPFVALVPGTSYLMAIKNLNILSTNYAVARLEESFQKSHLHNQRPKLYLAT